MREVWKGTRIGVPPGILLGFACSRLAGTKCATRSSSQYVFANFIGAFGTFVSSEVIRQIFLAHIDV
jgi:hypothetical protein